MIKSGHSRQKSQQIGLISDGECSSDEEFHPIPMGGYGSAAVQPTTSGAGDSIEMSRFEACLPSHVRPHSDQLRGVPIERRSHADSESYMASADEIMQRRWWRHPKFKRHFRVILGSLILLLIGIALLGYGVWAFVEPDMETSAWVFIVLGLLCFIPGAYHTFFIGCALCGNSSYHMEVITAG